MKRLRIARKKPRTLYQKFIELVLALRLELQYSKEEILAIYARNAPFGGNVEGLEAASWRYVGRPPARLSWGEATALAVLPNSPSLVYPGKNSRILEAKRNRLLDDMMAEGMIDTMTRRFDKLESLPVTGRARGRDRVYQYV